MWFLEHDSTRYAGCVELRPYSSWRSAEVTYLLDPRYWGQGLAPRMAWTVITHAFLSSQIDSVIAGTDLPNTASLAVMRRLGMRFHKDVHYPLGPGVEYVLRRDDAEPLPNTALIPLKSFRPTGISATSGYRPNPSRSEALESWKRATGL
jgi:RimJ/RimL family protein N-acetyltransferase